MSTIETRHDQMFPALERAEIDRLRRFGEIRRFSAGEHLFTVGAPTPGMFILIAGRVAVSSRDGLGHVAPIAELGPGQFLAEIAQLSGRPSLVDAIAKSDVEALLVTSDNLRALLIAEAEVGERIMRALILRRVALIENGAGGPILIGAATSAEVLRLQGFLWRNGYPHQLCDPADDQDARALVERYAPEPIRLAASGLPKRNRAQESERGRSCVLPRHDAVR